MTESSAVADSVKDLLVQTQDTVTMLTLYIQSIQQNIYHISMTIILYLLTFYYVDNVEVYVQSQGW